MTDDFSHTYNVGDTVLADFDGALIPAIIEAHQDDGFSVRLSRPWTDTQSNVSDSVELPADRLRPYAGQTTTLSLAEHAVGAGTPEERTPAPQTNGPADAPDAMGPAEDLQQRHGAAFDTEPTGDLQQQHDAAFRAWGEAFHANGYGSPEEQGAFAEVERLGLQLAEQNAGIQGQSQS